jgi:uncharacterized protein YndB with AHSA1/START domain
MTDPKGETHMSSETLIFEKSIQAAPALVYRAFTNASALREWMCDGATLAPHPGGRFYAWWNAGYYACGEFIAVEEDQSATFTWQGRGQAPHTRVQVSLKGAEGGTRLTLVHTIEGAGPEVESTIKDFRSEWPRSLENLASVLETGQDLRFVKRPMLGILLNDFNAEIADQLGVPVDQGVRLDGVVQGMGAESAGLQKDDVLISLGGQPVEDFPSLTVALQGHQAGDNVEVVFYRGPELKTVQMRLSARPLPEIPATPEEMAERAQAISLKDLGELEAALKGISEEEASYKPSTEVWNAKEILAHLIHSERELHSTINDLYSGQERVADDFGSNIYARVAATVAVYPTLPDLLEELKRTITETGTMIAAAPPEFINHKGSYTRLGYYCLESSGSHILGHMAQIEAVVEAARQAKTGSTI